MLSYHDVFKDHPCCVECISASIFPPHCMSMPHFFYSSADGIWLISNFYLLIIRNNGINVWVKFLCEYVFSIILCIRSKVGVTWSMVNIFEELPNSLTTHFHHVPLPLIVFLYVFPNMCYISLLKLSVVSIKYLLVLICIS